MFIATEHKVIQLGGKKGHPLLRCLLYKRLKRKRKMLCLKN